VSVSSPISPVVDHLADLALWEAELAADPQAASSLAMRLAQVPDPRDPRGRRHPLVVVLALTACATLVVGNDCVTAIWQWASGTGQDVLARIGARYDGWTGRYVVPGEATFRRVLSLWMVTPSMTRSADTSPTSAQVPPRHRRCPRWPVRWSANNAGP